MDTAKIRSLAQQIIDETNTGTSVPSSSVIKVAAGANLQAVVDQAADGSVLQLEPANYEVGMLKVSKSLTFQPPTLPGPARASKTAPVWLIGNGTDTVSVDGSNVKFIGVGMKNTNPDGELANIVGTNVLFDRVTGLGDPLKGLHRGFLVHGQTINIVKCWMEDIFAFGRDSSCIGGWDGGKDILITDCYLCGGAETIIFGGADSKSPDRIPSRISITNCLLTKKPEWYAMGVQIKNAFELKSAINVYMADCVLEYGGTAQGQGAYLILLTVRNQNGKAPWSVIRDVVIERCLGRNGGGAVSFLGIDDNFPSEAVDGVTFRNVKFTNIDPKAGPWKGDGRGFVFQRAPRNVIFDGVTLEGNNLSAVGYFGNTPMQPVGLTLRNMVLPKSTYGWKIDAGSLDIPPASKNIKALMPDLKYEVTATDIGAVGYPQA